MRSHLFGTFCITSRRIDETYKRHIINVWEQSHTNILLREGVDKCVEKLMIYFYLELIILLHLTLRDSDLAILAKHVNATEAKPGENQRTGPGETLATTAR